MSETKKAICESYLRLVEKMSPSAISVQSVCAGASLSRRTFSRHFASLEDVIGYQIHLDLIKPINDLADLIDSTALDNEFYFERALRAIKKHAAFYKGISKTYGSSWLADKITEQTLNIDFEPYQNGSIDDPFEMEFVTWHFAHSVASTYCWWIEGGMSADEHTLAHLVEKWIYARFREMDAKGDK